ncbi:MarR family transcriptional regulator [Thalassospira mesophila]|uniref:MarR family transcriptional regulator n=1 Tax=Thalassospira mesophila TaxID=1293891 RepID=A0A1Y2L506_9PROT|nr:MarR family transcriptional regulator [Thalassospira mesophila]
MNNPNYPKSGFGPLLAQAARQWRRAVDLGLQPFGLTEATWLPLVHLARAPEPLRQKQLAEGLMLDGSAVVRLLDCLQKNGLIDRREEAEDRRAKTIVITDAGRVMVEKVETAAANVRGHALSGLSDEDITTTLRVLSHVARQTKTGAA